MHRVYNSLFHPHITNITEYSPNLLFSCRVVHDNTPTLKDLLHNVMVFGNISETMQHWKSRASDLGEHLSRIWPGRHISFHREVVLLPTAPPAWCNLIFLENMKELVLDGSQVDGVIGFRSVQAKGEMRPWCFGQPLMDHWYLRWELHG